MFKKQIRSRKRKHKKLTKEKKENKNLPLLFCVKFVMSQINFPFKDLFISKGK